jgi:hypothetical protein
MVIESLKCSECGRPIIYAEAELATAPPCCPACPSNGVLITEEYVTAALAEAQKFSESEEYLRWQQERVRKEAARQADPEAVRAAANAEEAAHNEELAKECPPGWGLVAIYEDYRDEKGWLYTQPSGRWKVRAPGGYEAVLDLENSRELPQGWSVERQWVNFCYKYMISAPNGAEMNFFDSWNA